MTQLDWWIHRHDTVMTLFTSMVLFVGMIGIFIGLTNMSLAWMMIGVVSAALVLLLAILMNRAGRHEDELVQALAATPEADAEARAILCQGCDRPITDLITEVKALGEIIREKLEGERS